MRPVLPLPPNEIERFWSLAEKGDGCWLWRGPTGREDRALFSYKFNRVAARVAWALTNGREPDGFVCHSCDNPRCVNPEHLWIGTNQDNIRDAAAKGRLWTQRKTHCKRGHPLSGDNVFKTSQGNRSCRICQRSHVAKWSETAMSKVTPAQASALRWLKANGGLSVPNMNMAGKSREWPNTRTLRVLVKKGLLAFTQGEFEWSVNLTSAGIEMLEQIQARKALGGTNV
jgi:hypothetical protein